MNIFGYRLGLPEADEVATGIVREVDLKALEKIFRGFEGKGESILIPLVQAIQAEYGFLPKEALVKASHHFRIPLSRFYGVVTFYAQFYLTPRGKHTIRCCRGTACHVRGAAKVIETVEQELGLKEGETSEDLSFSFETVACLGACALAPVVVLDERYYGQMNPEKVRVLVRQYKGASIQESSIGEENNGKAD
ncbi:MAG: NAD(P)H-dependent oxidoreductase subunit E [Planctomycetota bacterium]|nr:NAD(P)H-dependent oxidoreductase subunit E [Planctomycetota bacterium]